MALQLTLTSGLAARAEPAWMAVATTSSIMALGWNTPPGNESETGLWAYDGVQVASALTLPPPPHGVKLTFVSADEGLLTVTKKLGCPIENPNLHP